MKVTKKLQEFASMNELEIKATIERERAALAQMRMSSATMQVKDYSQYRKKRKIIAQALTLLRNNVIRS